MYRKPWVCGISSLGIDHTSILGDTIEEIAWQKAGIFKVRVMHVVLLRSTYYIHFVQYLLSMACLQGVNVVE